MKYVTASRTLAEDHAKAIINYVVAEDRKVDLCVIKDESGKVFSEVARMRKGHSDKASDHDAVRVMRVAMGEIDESAAAAHRRRTAERKSGNLRHRACR